MGPLSYLEMRGRGGEARRQQPVAWALGARGPAPAARSGPRGPRQAGVGPGHPAGRRRRRPAVLALAVPLCFAGCRASPPAGAIPPPDLAVLLGFDGGARAGGPGELWIGRSRAGGWLLRFRRARARTEWPPVFDRTYRCRLKTAALAAFVRDLERSGVFELPGTIESPGRNGAIRLEIHAFGRFTRIAALGRTLPAFDRALAALDRVLPIRVGPYVDWLPAAPARGRPAVPADLDRARAFHAAWLAEEPGRTTLLLDLFALALARGARDEARRLLARIGRDRRLAGLVPALEERLNRRPAAAGR